MRDRLTALGVGAVVIDSGILGEPTIAVRRQPARGGRAPRGYALDDVRAAGSRGAAVALMREGVREVVVRLFADGRVHGVLCLGGAEGGCWARPRCRRSRSACRSCWCRRAPRAGAAFGDFVGESDVCVMHSVVDILGLNGISRPIFDNAAAAMAGMVTDAGSALGHARRALRRDHDARPDDARRDAAARGGWSTPGTSR